MKNILTFKIIFNAALLCGFHICIYAPPPKCLASFLKCLCCCNSTQNSIPPNSKQMAQQLLPPPMPIIMEQQQQPSPTTQTPQQTRQNLPQAQSSVRPNNQSPTTLSDDDWITVISN